MDEVKFIPLSVPNLKGKELDYVTTAVETEWVSTAGPYVTDFEKNIARYVGVERAVSCQSGTAGLHIALMLCGVERGDLVPVPTLTFIASVNPIKYIGAEPIFMDCDDSLCMDPVKLEKFLKKECFVENETLYHRASGRRIPAIVVVHIFGNMADMEAFVKLSKKYCFKIVEDACEALGTYYTEGEFAGRHAGTIGDMGVYSFNGNKIVTTGGGGMIVSNDAELLEHAKHLTTQAKADEANFIHDEIGYNYRLTNLQSALGIAQLEQLEDFIKIKEANYSHYKERLEKIPGLEILNFKEGTRSNRWFFALSVEPKLMSSTQELIGALREEKIQSRPIWGLIHEQAPYRDALTYDISKANYYYKRIVNLPCSTNLSSEDVDRVCEVIEKFVEKKRK